eukprot:CAMPEP_0184474668 /NCGR_PEP_ID=MMETSP0740-20130409/137315_1 /TAXON_ID=385413 /ORGANISM="Thalassiosira miniscula, Strain CCMP1093" /LENGTH=40 /DNA_ID= /DNA_START= /DNA_END= /DNA_ORIENTATION=
MRQQLQARNCAPSAQEFSETWAKSMQAGKRAVLNQSPVAA